MRTVYALSVLCFFNFLSFCQIDQVRIEKEYSEMDFAPQIAGYFNGEIPVNKICDVRGIFTNRGIKVIVFDLELNDIDRNEPIHIVGNQIPDSICSDLLSARIEHVLHFTNIKAIDLDGSMKHLSPMKLTVVFEEED